MTVCAAAIALIKEFEGFRSHPYQDQAGNWTIGYGETENITKATPPVTEAQASAELEDRLDVFQDIVDDHIFVDLNENQYGALVSLAYNIGHPPFVGQLGAFVNAKQWQQAADAFLQWDHVNGIPNSGLLRRRTAERKLFLTPTNNPST